jgi:hypothetical protein
MKICPVCNDSFADELNFCDVDGTRLAREDSAQERNKWWSLLGAGLLVAAVLITAGSIFFLPKARVSPPVVNSEPKSTTVPPAAPSVDGAAKITPQTASTEPENATADAMAPELKKKDRVANGNVAEAAPNPKAAALAAEDGGKAPAANDATKNDTSVPKAESTPPVKSISDTRAVEATTKPAQTPPDVKKDHQSQSVNAKSAGKDQDAKKKNDDKDKKKGGFLRVFKKIFGKD